MPSDQDIAGSLDRLHRQLMDTRAMEPGAIAVAVQRLHEMRNSTPDWRSLVDRCIGRHPVVDWLRQCPLTNRAACRPGAPGDNADFIDLIYDTMPSPAGFSTADAIYAYTSSSAACRAVRYRRHRIADLIDTVANQATQRGRAGIRVLSVAAGRARELLLSSAFRTGLVSEFVALEADRRSLDELRGAMPGFATRITCVQSDIHAVLHPTLDWGRFDLIYCAGLYDYLTESVARRLTRELFELLAEGGVLLYANFAEGIVEAGYMEAVMDWWLTLRSERQAIGLAQDALQGRPSLLRFYQDPGQQIHFVELRRHDMAPLVPSSPCNAQDLQFSDPCAMH